MKRYSLIRSSVRKDSSTCLISQNTETDGLNAMWYVTIFLAQDLSYSIHMLSEVMKHHNLMITPLLYRSEALGMFFTSVPQLCSIGTLALVDDRKTYYAFYKSAVMKCLLFAGDTAAIFIFIHKCQRLYRESSY